MNYYEVGVVKKAIRAQGVLTYASEDDIPTGSIVEVPIGKQSSIGVIYSLVKKPKFQTKLIKQVMLKGAIPEQLLKTALWVQDYYQSDIPEITNLLIPKGINKNRRTKNTISQKKHSKTGKLSDDQNAAMKKLEENKQATVLLHGVTGSGKTKIYIERAKQVIAENKGVIVLVPEIGLTSQIVADFRSEFPDVFVVHSNLSESQKHQTWEAIRQAENPIVIGARSALFSPVKRLGLIIVDEEHETSYKQDQSPKYHAVRVASFLASQHKAQLILGSATPSIEDYYIAKQRNLPVITISKPVIKKAASKYSIIDLKERDMFVKGSGILSKTLVGSIEKALEQGKQAMLFHNRRGTATMIVCTNCGWLAECKNCLLPLTHHHDLHKLICHVCNFHIDSPISCPDCKQASLLYKGFGTKQIVEDVNKAFPRAKIARFDSDVKVADQLEKRYDELREGSIDIIIGTQMVAKGLDLPKLNVVGVILADMSLYLPDYSANERTFQLLRQVSGRVGRHSSDSEVVIQSYTPDHPAIIAAVNNDYQSFYETEIAQRKQTKYPPFKFLLSLHVERAKKATAIEAAEKLAGEISQSYPGLEVLGPTPAFRERTPGGYRWQLVIKANNRQYLQRIVAELPSRWSFDLDPINLL